jgi:hypothetical protein
VPAPAAMMMVRLALTASMAFFIAAPTQSPAEISLARAPDGLLITVHDPGRGLDGHQEANNRVRPSGVSPAASTSCSRARSSRLWLESPAGRRCAAGRPALCAWSGATAGLVMRPGGRERCSRLASGLPGEQNRQDERARDKGQSPPGG